MAGFTLIETVLYIGLVVIIVGSMLAFAYAVITDSNTLRNSIELIENAKFFQQKLRWLVVGATAITVPAPNASGGLLTLTKSGTTYTVDIASGSIRLKTDVVAPLAITNSFVTVTSLSFSRFSFSSSTKDTIRVRANIKNFSTPVAASISIDFYVPIQ